MCVLLAGNCGRVPVRKGELEKLPSRQDLLRKGGRNNHLDMILFTFNVREMQLQCYHHIVDIMYCS